jgi:hypothetical protein
MEVCADIATSHHLLWRGAWFRDGRRQRIGPRSLRPLPARDKVAFVDIDATTSPRATALAATGTASWRSNAMSGYCGAAPAVGKRAACAGADPYSRQ